MHFLTSAEYYPQLIARVESAQKGDRIALMTLAFDPDEPLVGQLLQALEAAAARGAAVTFIVDAFIFLVGKGAALGPLFYHRTLDAVEPGFFGNRLDSLTRLQASGGTAAVTNLPARRFTNPFSGRSHIKFAVINDTIWLGGCNLADTAYLDTMVTWRDHATADWLYELAQATAARQSVRRVLHNTDQTRQLTDTTQLLVDAGKRRQSHILRTAIQLIDDAQHNIIITSQYLPTGVVSRHLHRAIRRGVNVTFIYNHPLQHRQPLRTMYRVTGGTSKMYRSSHLFAHRMPEHSPYLHAKILVTDRGAIVGSHNYASAGVRFGTAEIALYSTDPTFRRNAHQMISRLCGDYLTLPPTSAS